MRRYDVILLIVGVLLVGGLVCYALCVAEERRWESSEEWKKTYYLFDTHPLADDNDVVDGWVL